MVGFFLDVLNISLKATYVIIFVIIIRQFLKKSPKIISYALWSVVAFRLIIPISFESVVSIFPENFNDITIPNEIIYQQTPEINIGMEIPKAIINESHTATPIINDNINSFNLWLRIGAYIWIAGIIVLIMYSLISIVLLKRQLKSGKIVKENIFEVKNLKTPFVFGLIKPKIYLPYGIKDEERYYILLHEEIHIKRKDHIIKVLSFLILSIHWFNPFVWISFILMSKDMELSCDERVLKEVKEDIKKPYATTLLSLSSNRFVLNGSPLAFGEGNVKERIKNVLNYKRPRFWVMMLTVILVGGLAIGLMANPKSNESFENPTQSNTNIDANMDNNPNGLEDKVPEEIIDLDKIDNEIKEVSMTIKEGTLSTSKATIIFTNKTEKEVVFGEYFHLEKKIDEEWKELPTIIENYGFDDIAYPLNEKKSRELVIDWEWLYGTLNEGEYRIVKDVYVSDFSSTADYDKYYLYAEFNINKEADFNKLGLNIQLPENENWIYNPVYKIVDGKIAQVEYFDKIAELDVTLRAGKEDIKTLSGNEYSYDKSKEESWSARTINNHHIPIKVQVANIGGEKAMVLVSWRYEEFHYVLYGETRLDMLDTTPLAKTAVYIAQNTEQSAEMNFTEDEVKEARAVVEEYFRAMGEKDSQAILKTWTPEHNTPNMVFGDEIYTLNFINYSENDPMRKTYVENGRGSVNNTPINNVIVFRVDYNIKYPEGKSGAFDGDYVDWSIILIRDNQESPWFIDDQGY